MSRRSALYALNAGQSSSSPRLRVIVPSSRAAEELEGATSLQAAYLRILTCALTFFIAVRVLSYLPMLWTIWQSGDSGQHSPWTRGTWSGANLTMSLWLIERNKRRVDRATIVDLGNTAMGLAVIVLIIVQRA